MLKVVSMWKLPEGMSEQEFEKWYREKHIGDAKKIPACAATRSIGSPLPSGPRRLIIVWRN